MSIVTLRVNQIDPKKARIGRHTSFVVTLPKAKNGDYRVPPTLKPKDLKVIGVENGKRWYFSLKPNMVFNTEKDDDRIMLELLKSDIFSSIIAKTKNEASSLHRFYFDDPKIEGEIKSSVRQKRYEAEKLLFSLNEKERMTLLEVGYGYLVDGFTSEMVVSALGDEIDKNPENFISKVKDPHRKTLEELNNLVKASIVRIEDGTKYYFNQLLLGVDKMTAVAYLENPKNAEVVGQFIDLLNK